MPNRLVFCCLYSDTYFCYLVICDVSWSCCIDCGLSLFPACVPVFLGEQMFPGGIWVQGAFAQGQLWGAKWNTEGSFPRFLLNSCELRVLGGSLRVEMLVFPVLTAMSALLGAQIFPGGIWIWKTLAQDQLLDLLHRISQFIYFYWLLSLITFQMLTLFLVSSPLPYWVLVGGKVLDPVEAWCHSIQECLGDVAVVYGFVGEILNRSMGKGEGI